MDKRKVELLNYLKFKLDDKGFWEHFRSVHRLENKIELLDSEIQWAREEIKRIERDKG